MIRAVIPPPPAVVRRATLLAGKAWAIVFFTLGVLVGIGSMTGLYSAQVNVTRELVAAWGKRVNMLEEQYKLDHASSLKTSKAWAAVFATKMEGVRKEK